MELKLVLETDPILKQVADPWDFEIDGDPSELIKAMGRTMLINIGIGLAAVQVGIKKRLFIIGNDMKIVAYINPEIIEGFGEQIGTEGCLSFPELRIPVKRYEEIKIRYQNETGEVVYDTLTGLAARVFQHEYDHLNGVCFVAHVGAVALMRAKQKRKKLRKSFDQRNAASF